MKPPRPTEAELRAYAREDVGIYYDASTGTWDIIKNRGEYPRVLCSSRTEAKALAFLRAYALYLAGLGPRPVGFTDPYW